MTITYNGNDAANRLAATNVFPYTAIVEINGYGGNDELRGAFLHFNAVSGGVGNDTIYGGAMGNTLLGEDGNDLINSWQAGYSELFGGTGNDYLIGGNNGNLLDGGLGDDTLIGGEGTDIYVVNSLYDQISESYVPYYENDPNPRDSVLSSISWTLGNNIEDLSLTGAAANNATGNSLANTLTGNTAANILNGSIGADTMLGGEGNDTYEVDNTDDRVFETTTTTSTTNAGGTDLVRTSVSFSLNASAGVSFVENLWLNSSSAISGTGNALSNTIVAGGGNNTIDGLGGSDTVSYLYATARVSVDLRNSSAAQNTTSSGSDLIKNVENVSGSNFNDTLRGNNGINALIGNRGSDTLYGYEGNDILRGGTGNDVLYGGTGQDIFRFDTALTTSTVQNLDQIKDFVVADDTIQLENSIFTKLGATSLGTINSAYFKAISTGGATDSNDFIVYNKTTGALFYDADGGADGNTDGIQIATIGANLTTLGYTDFSLI